MQCRGTVQILFKCIFSRRSNNTWKAGRHLNIKNKTGQEYFLPGKQGEHRWWVPQSLRVCSDNGSNLRQKWIRKNLVDFIIFFTQICSISLEPIRTLEVKKWHATFLPPVLCHELHHGFPIQVNGMRIVNWSYQHTLPLLTNVRCSPWFSV